MKKRLFNVVDYLIKEDEKRVIHNFRPKVYYNAFGAYPPALRISSGDIVVTSTIDNIGRDASDEQVAKPGNPLTGPFYVEGAEPNDVLAVYLEKLWPNRRLGRSSSVLSPNVVDPEYVMNLPPFKHEMLAEWEIDLEKGTATLIKPEVLAGELILPINPMLGCIGVAPPKGQAISSATSGKYGGNMDYRGFVSGVTVYLPIFAEGALFFIGDGHAVQGDGEIIGTGIEVSFDVRFKVKVIKDKSIEWPRAENKDYIMTVGNARPLDQALQHATTEMLRWLQEGYGLGDEAAHILLGECVEYDVGNVFDPAYTIVCKIKKKWIEIMRKDQAAP